MARRKINADEHGGEWYKLSSLKKGEYVRRQQFSKKIYRKGDYDRGMKAYEMHDTEDISRSIYCKANAQVYAGFLY